MVLIKHTLVIVTVLLVMEAPKVISRASSNFTKMPSMQQHSVENSSRGFRSTSFNGSVLNSSTAKVNVSHLTRATTAAKTTDNPQGQKNISAPTSEQNKEVETLKTFLETIRFKDRFNSTKFLKIIDIVLEEAKTINLPTGDSSSVYDLGLSFLGLPYSKIIKRILNTLEPREVFPKTDDVTPSCYEDIMALVDALVGFLGDTDKQEYLSMDWAVRMVDAFGKPSAGLLSGALQFVGDYDECLRTRAKIPSSIMSAGDTENQTTREFGTRYCRVRFPVAHQFKLAIPKGTNKFWASQKNFPIYINWGICVPETCHSDDVKAFLTNGTLKVLKLPVEEAVCFEEPHLKDDGGAITTLCIISLFCTSILTCTVVDVYLRNRPWFSNNNAIDSSERDVVFDVIELQHINDVSYEVEAPTEDENYTNDLHVQGEVIEENGGKKVDLDTNAKLSNGSQRISQQVTVNVNGKADVSTKSGMILLESSTKETQPENCGKENGVGANGIQNCRVKEKRKSRGEQLIQGFSAYTNMLYLLNTERSSGSFDCIQGLRVISMAWIVLGHCYTFGGCLDETNIIFKNTLALVETPARLSFHIVGSAHLAVDTFFVISGCLVMVFSLRALERRKPNLLFWITFFFHRFWRLTPVYMIAMTLGTTLYDHVVQGPLKADKFEEFYQCKDKWWSHLLYFNNFYKPEKKCMTWTWFMAVDMQLYLLSPLFIYPVYRNLKFGIGLTISFFIIGIAGAFVAEYQNGGQFVLMDLSFLEYWSYVYTMPWARCGAFTIGLLLGIVLHHHKGRPVISKPKAFLIWTMAVALAIFLVLVNHHQWKLNSEHWSRVSQSFYEALVRPLWAICVAWVVYACSTGLGGIAYDILSWSPFLVLSRLCYSVYLIHPLVIVFVAYSRRTPIYLHPAFLTLTYNYIGNLVLSYLCATVLYLMFEVPMTSLERIFLRGR